MACKPSRGGASVKSDGVGSHPKWRGMSWTLATLWNLSLNKVVVFLENGMMKHPTLILREEGSEWTHVSHGLSLGLRRLRVGVCG